MNKNKFGLILGSFSGFLHLFWGVLVAVGLAQPFLDFVYNIHSLYNPFLVAPFSFVRSIGLVIFTFLMGYIFGYILAFIWNKFSKIKQVKQNDENNEFDESNPDSKI